MSCCPGRCVAADNLAAARAFDRRSAMSGSTASIPLRVFAKIFVGDVPHCRKRQFSAHFGVDFVR
ncbi:UNVERIFIED_ORG: hypothetical protein J2W85_003149 [Ensifer adhaerens]|jgi:hypothetical protein|nr:hypothetical protein [Ensifer adhaerens]